MPRTRASKCYARPHPRPQPQRFISREDRHMNRRKFVKQSIAAVGASLVPPAVVPALAHADEASAAPQPPTGKINIQYIRQDIPHFEIPAYRGRHYEDTVPDTLDLAERAKLCIHALTS